MRGVKFVPPPESWAAPLPDLSQPALNQRIKIGAHVFRVVVSDVQRQVASEPDTHLVQIAVLYGNRPLTAYDLGLRSAEACANVWAFLTNRVNETVVQFYTPSRGPAASSTRGSAAGDRGPTWLRKASATAIAPSR